MEALRKKYNIAILDMYAGKENQGMRCIREIINQTAETCNANIVFEEFDVRRTGELPNLDYDAYISTGGPGSPIESIHEVWDKNWCAWFDTIIAHNQQHVAPKPVFLICHSFQMAARHLNLGVISQRKSTAFGVFPVHLLDSGKQERLFEGLKDPFYVVDSRDWQVTSPNQEIIASLDAQLLCLEKERPHVPLDRAIMGFRIDDAIIGTQFHPEADAIGMSMYLQTAEKKEIVIEQHGIDKWESMVAQLNDTEKILHTYNIILPNFIKSLVYS